jgi:hypothetical protein
MPNSYLTQVASELADLSAADRSGLLEDLAQHLEDLEREGADIPARLGPASAYAADLRAAAGLPPSGRPRFSARLGSLTALWRHPAVRAVRDFAAQLQPAWWVLRGYLLVALPTLFHADRRDDFPVPALLGSHVLGTLAVLTAIVASVALGRRRLPRPVIPAVLAANAVLVALAAGLVADAPSRLTRTSYIQVSPVALTDRYALVSKHGPITNIYPYDAQGRPLQGVLLFDQDGRPLRTALQQWWKDGCRRAPDYPRAADGVPVSFSYPETYVTTEAAPSSGPVCLPVTTRPAVPIPSFSPTASPSPR